MKGSRFFKISFLVIATVFIINQLLSSVYMPIKTENAVFYTANDGFKITGQIFSTYIIIEKGNEMILMDQHAAHERIIFNRMKEEAKEMFRYL